MTMQPEPGQADVPLVSVDLPATEEEAPVLNVDTEALLERLEEEDGLGRRTWVIAEGYIPSESTGPAPAMTSHETACILNTGERAAEIEITLYFSDREPAGPYRVRVEARRTLHLRFNDFESPEPVPRDTDYASVFRSNVPVVIQHTRLDSRQPPHALLSTVAWNE